MDFIKKILKNHKEKKRAALFFSTIKKLSNKKGDTFDFKDIVKEIKKKDIEFSRELESSIGSPKFGSLFKNMSKFKITFKDIVDPNLILGDLKMAETMGQIYRRNRKRSAVFTYPFINEIH